MIEDVGQSMDIQRLKNDHALCQSRETEHLTIYGREPGNTAKHPCAQHGKCTKPGIEKELLSSPFPGQHHNTFKNEFPSLVRTSLETQDPGMDKNDNSGMAAMFGKKGCSPDIPVLCVELAVRLSF